MPRPCLHCGSTSFHVIPGVQILFGRALGRSVMMKMGGKFWTTTIVACTQCGRTEMFTTDPAEFASYFPDAQIMTTTRQG